MSMATKLRRVVTYQEGFSLIKLNNPLITWSLISPQPPMVTALGRMVTYLEGLLPTKSHEPWSRVLTKLHDKIRPLYLHYYSVYRHQTWQDGDLTQRVPTHKVTKPLVTWVCKIAWQTKSIHLFALPQCPWPPNVAGWWRSMRASNP